MFTNEILLKTLIRTILGSKGSQEIFGAQTNLTCTIVLPAREEFLAQAYPYDWEVNRRSRKNHTVNFILLGI